MEEGRIHLSKVVRDAKRKLGLRENVALEVDAGRDLGDGDPFALKSKHASLGDVDDVLTLSECAGAGERDLLDRVYELLDFAFLQDRDGAVLHVKLRPRSEIAGEDDFLRPRGDVDETARARRDVRPHAELRDIDRAAAIDLQEREQRHVEARALKVGELVRRL